MDNLILYLLVLIIPLIAQINITSTYNKFRQVNNKKGLSGFEVARNILDENGLNDLYIVEVKGNLTDHYDPKQKVVRLSTEVFHGSSIAALSVAAHECGHAIQDKENYVWLKLRSFLCPVVNFITYSAYIFFFLGFFFQMIDLIWISIATIIVGLVFQIVTLPVEFNASARALDQVKKIELVDKNEYGDAEKMLKAAALTYVAAVLSSALNLIRMISLLDDRRR